MALTELLRLADRALSGRVGPQLPEELLRLLVEQSRSRAGVLRRGEEVVARWPRTVTSQVEQATAGWATLPLAGGGAWTVRLLQLENLDEAVLESARLVLSAFELREELKRAKFDERFHLWELEAIRSISTGIGGILDPARLAEELVAQLVALLGVRSALVYLGDDPSTASLAAAFGEPALEAGERAAAWEKGLRRDDVVALPLLSDAGTIGLLVAGEKEARAGTESFSANDLRLLELFAVQVTIAFEYVRLTRESLERERLRRELEVAAEIQAHLYPQRVPEVAGLRLAARSTPSRQVAGDTYDLLVRGGALLATVTDVSGKGVGAGMIASGVHAAVRLLAGEERPLDRLAARVNRYLCGATEENRFATFAMVRVSPDGELRGVNAGHCPLLLRRADGRVETIESSGLPLGILPEATYGETVSRLEPGDLVVLYTDGLTEAANEAEVELGVEGVAEVVARLGSSDADQACTEIFARVERFVGGRPLEDDATLVVVERLDGPF